VSANDTQGEKGVLKLKYAIMEDDEKSSRMIQGIVDGELGKIHLELKEAQHKRSSVTKVEANNLFSMKEEKTFLNELQTAVGDKRYPYPDLVLLDNNLSGTADSGRRTLEFICSHGYPIDSILYSMVSDLGGPNLQNDYGSTWIVSRGQNPSDPYFKGPIRSALSKFYLTWTNPEYVRGLVLSRFADLDVAWNDLVVAIIKVPTVRRNHFKEFALARDGLPLSVKAKNTAKIAQLLADKGEIDEDLLKKIRNFKERTINNAELRDDFAHNPIKLVGEDIEIRRKAIELGQQGKAHREDVKRYFVEVTKLISEIREATKQISKKRIATARAT
jgi:hypothetical protein